MYIDYSKAENLFFASTMGLLLLLVYRMCYLFTFYTGKSTRINANWPNFTILVPQNSLL